MRHLLIPFALILIIFAAGCDQDVTNTESITYELPALSANEISGQLTVTKISDNETSFNIRLAGTIKGFEYPTHLHFGDLSVPNASVAFLLNPTDGTSGISETIISNLSNDTPVTYEDLITGQFSVKIHLGEDAESKNIILTASNVGAAFDENGTKSIAVCSSGG